MVELIKYKHAVNAIWVNEKLLENGIHSEIIENHIISVDEEVVEKAKAILVSIEIEDEANDLDETFGSALENAQEWGENQYNPGHYLDGKTTPFHQTISSSLGWALMYLITGLAIIICYSIVAIFGRDPILYSEWGIIFSAIVSLIVGIGMMRNIYLKKRRNKKL